MAAQTGRTRKSFFSSVLTERANMSATATPSVLKDVGINIDALREAFTNRTRLLKVLGRKCYFHARVPANGQPRVTRTSSDPSLPHRTTTIETFAFHSSQGYTKI